MRNERDPAFMNGRSRAEEECSNVLAAAVRVFQSLSRDQPTLLWGESVSGSLLSALHDAVENSSPSVEDVDYSVEPESVRVQIIRTGELTSLLGAIRLVSGIPERELLDACVGEAIEQLRLILQEHVDDQYPELTDACPGEIDWSNASIVLEWLDAAAEPASCDCKAAVTVDGTLSFAIVSGMAEGDKQTLLRTAKCRVDEGMLVTVSIENNGVAEVDIDDDQIVIHAA